MRAGLLTSIDRSLTQRARANAAAAVRADTRHAAQRQEAARMLIGHDDAMAAVRAQVR